MKISFCIMLQAWLHNPWPLGHLNSGIKIMCIKVSDHRNKGIKLCNISYPLPVKSSLLHFNYLDLKDPLWKFFASALNTLKITISSLLLVGPSLRIHNYDCVLF